MSAAESIVLDTLDLNDSTNYGLESVEFPPPPRLTEWVRSADSDGSLLAREPPAENREITARIWIAQQASMDLALAKVAAITDKLQEAARNPGGIDLVWTPADSTLSVTFKVLYGEVSDLPVSFEAGWLGKAPTVGIKLVCSPFGEGAEITDVTDDYATNTIANYTLDTGGGTISVTGGQLVPSSTAEKRLIHTSSTYAPTDAWTTVKFTTGASVASGTAGAIAKRLDASNYLVAQVAAAGASTRVQIVKVDAGAATTLAQTSTFTLSTATNYWIRIRVEGNTLTGEMFTSAPTLASTPAQTVSHTLTAGDLTKYGSGIAGRNGIRLAPQATDWRADDLQIQPNTTRSTEPVLTLEVANVPGDVPAKIRAIVTDGATQSRRLVRAGLESRYYPTTSPPALLIDSASLVTSGYSGTATTRTGGYNANGVVRSNELFSHELAMVGLGDLSHVGTFRVFARVYADAATTATVYCRLSWREGSGPLRSNPWTTPPVVAAWAEVDLGIITIPEKILGTQRWTGQIDTYSAVDNENLDVDYIYLMPVGEGYGVARAAISSAFGTLVGYDGFTARTAGATLGATAAQLGGTWATSGAATDFAAADTPGTSETMTRATTLEAGPRYAILGATNYTDLEVGISVFVTAGTPEASVIARYVDSTHYLVAQLQYSVSRLRVAVNNGGGGQTVAVPWTPPYNAWCSLQLTVYTSGQLVAKAFDADGLITAEIVAQDAVLATGGALQTGLPAFADTNAFSLASARYYDNFYATVPSTEAVACNSSQSIEFRQDGIIREDSTGTYWGPPPEPRGGLRGIPPAGTRSRKSRIAVVARRNDVLVAADDQIADNTVLQVALTPRFLVAPRS